MALLGLSRCLVVAATAAACLAADATLVAQPAVPIEANVKAVFLFNFSKYVTWPPATIGERSPAEVRICVTANDGFFTLLKGAVQGEDIDGKPLVPVALEGLDDAKSCQILYVGDAHGPEASAWLSAVRGQQVLTVGDGALTDDIVIALVRENSRIRFDINRASASRRNLNISSKLLRLARQVRDR
jgi:YfiR/HmsC-like